MRKKILMLLRILILLSAFPFVYLRRISHPDSFINSGGAIVVFFILWVLLIVWSRKIADYLDKK